MKKKVLLLYFFLSSALALYAQPHTENKETKPLIHAIEDFILSKQLDSAAYYIDTVKNKTDYTSLLLAIINGEKLSYRAHQTFIDNTSKRYDIDYIDVSDYINTFIQTPEDVNQINVDYAKLKISQINYLREDEALDKASFINSELDSYLNQFDATDKTVVINKAHASSHNIIMLFIQRDFETAQVIIDKNLAIAEKYNDKYLAIVSLYHQSDILVNQRKLQAFIDVLEESLRIESQLEQNSSYHSIIVQHLIDGYIYKGGHEKRVLSLLNDVYKNKDTKLDSYALYAKYLAALPSNSEAKKEMFKKFEVTNTLEFTQKIRSETKAVFNINDDIHIVTESANALERDGYIEEALKYQRHVVNQTKNLYSQDLSKSLASFQTEQAVKIKDIDIENEKTRSKIYIGAGVVVAMFFLVALFFLWKSQKQATLLKDKNHIIDEALKEKVLLVKEVHHRVKNNFQIVSSLLELQTKGIEDEKALSLANDGKNRVKSMALIHQKLYQNENGLIDFEEYTQLLIKEITALYASDKKITTNVALTDMYFDVDTAIPLGLIINEIITNAYKYAFDSAENNVLNISINKLEKTDTYNLIIADSGPGLDDTINLKKVKSLGLRLVTRLVKQLQGTLVQFNKDGANFEITFKNTNARKSVS